MKKNPRISTLRRWIYTKTEMSPTTGDTGPGTVGWRVQRRGGRFVVKTFASRFRINKSLSKKNVPPKVLAKRDKLAAALILW